MNAKPLWGVGNKKNRFRADFHRPGTTPNLGINVQDAENRRGINFFDAQAPKLICSNFGRLNISPEPKYGGQTVKTPLTASKTVVVC